MKKIFKIGSLIKILILVVCHNTNICNAQTLKKINKDDFSILNENTFFKSDDSSYHYKNVRHYFIDDLGGISPYYLGRLLVKETEEIFEIKDSEQKYKTIMLDILPDFENGTMDRKFFKYSCDKIDLYSYFIECSTPEPAGGWTKIDLFKYDDFSKPFLKTDDQYWFFNMNRDNQHISKNCFIITLEKFPDDKVCILKLSDMNGLLQQVNINCSKEKIDNIEFYYPLITLKSDNPNEDLNHPTKSEYCKTFLISPKDYNDLRKSITKYKFELVFYNNENKVKKETIIIPIENGLFYNKTDKLINIEIFK